MVSDPASYAGAQIRLVAVDMDGTLLDDQKNFPPGLDELLDQLEERGIVFVPASGRQVWSLIDMFPDDIDTGGGCNHHDLLLAFSISLGKCFYQFGFHFFFR